jgi:hypothetical protein
LVRGKAPIKEIDMQTGKYWEKRVVCWDVITDDDGNVWKLNGEEVVDIIDSGVEDVEVSEYWQVMN